MSQKKLKIRAAKSSDCGLILFFIRELAKFEKLEHEVVATESKLRKTLFGKNCPARVIIAHYGTEPAGFALYFSTYSTFLAKPGIYLEDLFVRPELRGLGIGSQLLKELARLAGKGKCGRLEWSVLNWNKNAIRLYRRMGARPQSEWTVYRMTEKAYRKMAKS